MKSHKLFIDAIVEKMRSVIDLTTYPANMEMVEKMICEMSEDKEFINIIEFHRTILTTLSEERTITIYLKKDGKGIVLEARKILDQVTSNISTSDESETNSYPTRWIKCEKVGEYGEPWERTEN